MDVTDDDSESESYVEYRRRLRREAQRDRRSQQDVVERESLTHENTIARRAARLSLAPEKQAEIRRQNATTYRNKAALIRQGPHEEQWWDRVARLNVVQNPQPLSIRWNRVCNICGITALTGERIHAQCFVCGPNGAHRMPLLPDYPQEWNTFIGDRRTASLSRKLNNIFTLTALGVFNGDFMQFSSGISAVTLNGGRTYHRMLPAHEGQHAIRWFIHDSQAFLRRHKSLKYLRFGFRTLSRD
ncbi:hypothetical protein B0H13DRAFT_146965 [Mycena leptocephala]|nr:hypothetical protein B0H13DRAFT_146965 [Mycena leptocephala]